MADISKIKINGTSYNIKDAVARSTSATSASVEALTTRVTANEKNITSNTEKITTITSDVSALKAKKHYTIAYNETDESLSIAGDK